MNANDYCQNCGKQYQHHTDEKCPFEASNFALRKGFFTFEEPGVGIGNIASIQKIKFFDVSVVETETADSAPLVVVDTAHRS